MKTFLCFVLGLCISSLAIGQPGESVGVARRTPDELQKLLSPIAIYPDALIAIILPASTASSDIVLASRYLDAGGDPAKLDNQSWEPSVISLARYPEVVKWMDQNLEWTRELGEAFASQPTDVMNAVQALRKKATQAGLLTTTAQQNVVVRDEEIYIEPAQPDVIYVPTYDPEVIYMGRPSYGPWLGFSVGFATGSWLNYDCDWRDHSVFVYHHSPGWQYRPDWRRDHDHERQPSREGHSWTPAPGHSRYVHLNPEHASRPVPRVEPPRFAGSPHEAQRGSNMGPGRGTEVRGNPSHSGIEPAGNQPREERSGIRENAGPKPGPGVAPLRHSEPVNRVEPPAARQQAPTGAPSARVAQPQSPNRLSRSDGDQRRYIHENPTSPQIQAPPVSPQLSRPERVGSLTPREGARPIQRSPDAVSASHSSHAVQAAPTAQASHDSRNTSDDKNRR